MYADDGIMLSNNREHIEAVVNDFKLPIAGIYFSNKQRKDGTLASGYFDRNLLNFLGAVINFSDETITTEKGQCNFNDSLGDFMKIL